MGSGCCHILQLTDGGSREQRSRHRATTDRGTQRWEQLRPHVWRWSTYIYVMCADAATDMLACKRGVVTAAHVSSASHHVSISISSSCLHVVAFDMHECAGVMLVSRVVWCGVVWCGVVWCSVVCIVAGWSISISISSISSSIISRRQATWRQQQQQQQQSASSDWYCFHTCARERQCQPESDRHQHATQQQQQQHSRAHLHTRLH